MADSLIVYITRSSERKVKTTICTISQPASFNRLWAQILLPLRNYPSSCYRFVILVAFRSRLSSCLSLFFVVIWVVPRGLQLVCPCSPSSSWWRLALIFALFVPVLRHHFGSASSSWSFSSLLVVPVCLVRHYLGGR